VYRSILVRFVLPVTLASCVVAYFALPYVDRLLTEWFRADIELRAQLVMSSMEEPIEDLVADGNGEKLRTYLARITNDQRLMAIVLCRPDNTTILRTERAPLAVSCDLDLGRRPESTRILQLAGGSIQVSQFRFDSSKAPFRVLLVHDLSFVDRRQRSVRDFLLLFLAISVLLLALLVVFVAWLQIRR